MSQKSIELRTQRAALVQEMHDLTEKTEFKAEAKSRWDSLDAQQKELETRINAIEASDKLAEEMAKTPHIERSQPNGNPGGLPQREDRAKVVADKRNSPEYAAAFEQTIRTGRIAPALQELRT